MAEWNHVWGTWPIEGAYSGEELGRHGANEFKVQPRWAAHSLNQDPPIIRGTGDRGVGDSVTMKQV